MTLYTEDEMQIIKTFILAGEFGKIIKDVQKKDNTLSKNKLLQILHCKEKELNRWLKKERTFSMPAFVKLIKYTKFDTEWLFYSIDDKETFYAEYLPQTYEGSIIWSDLDKNPLVNCLYFYRKYLNPMSVFKMAFMLEIDPRTLLNYESGREKIPGELWNKFCNTLHLKLEELFPSFRSYDGGNTYSIMHSFYLKWTFNLSIDEINIDGYTVELFDLYMYHCEEELLPIFLIWQRPLKRYSNDGRVISTVSLREITIDEYYNTEDEMLVDDMLDDFVIKYSLNNLPPYYYRKDKLWMNKTKLKEDSAYSFDNGIVESIEFIQPYTIKIRFEGRNQDALLDMNRYIESESLWYQQLRDYEYFCKGKIVIDEEMYCIVWPNGQYIAVGDWTMDSKRVLPNKTYNSIKDIRFCLQPKYNNEPWKF